MRFKNKRKGIALSALSFLLLSLFLLTSCAKGNKFVSNGEEFRDKKTEVVYKDALPCYEPIEMGKEIYGHTKDVKFYKVAGQNPLNLICEEGGTVFYSGISLPTVDKMNLSYIDICTEASNTVSRKKITQSEKMSEIAKEYERGENIYYAGLTPALTYKIRFADESLGLYYCVTFVRYNEDYKVKSDGTGEENFGKDFIYNRFENKFVKAPEALVEYINEIK